MKKIFLILAAFCCFSANAQNVGDVFSVPSPKGTYKITSISPNTVTLVTATTSKDNPRYELNYSTVEYGGTTYDITSVQQDAFRHHSNVNAELYFNKLSNISTAAFYNVTCYGINLSGSHLTVIPNNAFMDANCKEVFIPESVTRISANAFKECTVSTLNASNLTYIDDAAFFWCRSLTSIDLSKVTYIGGAAFYGCSALSSIDLSSVTYIGGSAFEECTKLKNITLSQCLETVKEHAFEDCFLTSLSLYNTVNTFENSGDIMADNGTVTMNIVSWSNKNVLANFAGYNRAITYKCNDEIISGNYTLPDTITSLGEGAFYHNIDITIINMPSSLTQIGAKALAKCSNLSAIHCDAPTAPVVADANAFDDVDKNINIFIPDNAESYYSYTHTTGWNEFSNYLVSLQTIKGAAIIELNHTAGSSYSQAVKDIIADYSAQIDDADDKATVEALTQEGVEAIIAQIAIDRGLVKIGNLYYLLDSGHHTATVTYGGLEANGYATAEYTGSVTIPATVEHENATYNVTLIGEHAFQNCTGLTAVTFPDNITEINKYAFYNCSNIQHLVLPYKTTYIHSYAFSSCTALRTLELPYMIQAIDNLAFENCSALTAITSLSPAPSALGYSPFNGVSKSIPVTVQGSSLAAYQQGPWGGFTNFVTNTDLDTAKTNAKNAIVAALGSYSFVNYIGNLAMGFCQRIEAGTTIEQVEALGTEGLYAVTYAVSTYQEILGEMGDPCTDCPAVNVIKGTKTVKLYNPEKVEFIKN